MSASSEIAQQEEFPTGIAIDEPVLPGWRLFLRRQARLISAVLTLLIFVVVGFAIFHLTDEVRYDDVVAALRATNLLSIAAAIAFTALSFAALTIYDVDALEYIGRKLPYPQVALTAFSAYAVGNTAGFGPLSGGAIRYRAYSRLGLSPDEIGRVIAFVTLAFGLGLASVASLSLLVIGEDVAPLVGVSSGLLQTVAGLVLAGLVALLIWARGGRVRRVGRFSLKLPDSRTTSRQFLVTCLDIAASATVLYMLLPGSVTISWPAFLGLYAVAVGLGVLSHVPAGLGVFDGVIVAALSGAANVEQVLGSLVLYRLIYHVLPLVIAMAATITVELRRQMGNPALASLRRLGGRLSPTLVSALTVVVAAILIFSGVTPLSADRSALFATVLPLPVVEAAHFLCSLLGLALFVSARGLSQRLDGAWWLAMLSSLTAVILTLVNTVSFIDTALLAFLAISLFATRKLFHRPASLFGQALTTPWLMAMTVICATALFILFFVYRDVEYSHQLWWQFEFSGDAPRSLRAILGLSVAASLVALASLLRPAAAPKGEPGPEDLDRAYAIVDRQDNADANLVRMGDKNLLYSPDGRAFIMYGRQGRSWIALFDPIGPQEIWAELVWHFLEQSRLAGCRPVFYQISPALLSACADAGMRAYRLGELATTDLRSFTLEGGKRANLRSALSRMERDGIEFEVIPVEGVPAVLDQLAAVSDAWLSVHKAKEKGFSLGAFDPDYIRTQPVAVLRLNGRIVAFANLLLTGTKAEASIDLMRFTREAPKGVMDILFVRIMLYLRDQGYGTFNLGMAPLSGLSRHEVAPVWDVIGRTVFDHGERYYNFKGLRAFKEKFHPRWQPRYLAVPGGVSPALALLDATLLIGAGIKGVIGK
ncbi:bifunctional lysylphosphatidylglycerol flippase/synthetase MprF [Rhizobiaceae bacterium n13]|uniref:bifunctional lysylphosphatidylglycerol flippase/synthetase MprF n=1 Tax=Ferirhizobium litorale TaxID=2927786 RepID=UPI0024B30BD2|nr:bifunctional lysylphosphatidylglycerol flippase/synthetase MprF [Fererhizobium litorale]MDI7862324.1 bifunctional lysylphosphatidylglycerol flippase/synthetase MprF [Fererhizobium litorale]